MGLYHMLLFFDRIINMQALLFAAIAFFGWGVGDIFETITVRRIGAIQASFWIYLSRVIIFSVLIPFSLQEIARLTLDTFLLNILLSFFLIFGTVAFYKGLNTYIPSLVGTIAASFVGLVVIFSMVFLGERINNLQTISIIVIFIGIVLATLNLEAIRKGNHGVSQGMVFAFIAMICWGIYFTFIKIPVYKIGWFWPHYISYLLFPLILPFIRFKKMKLNPPNYKKAFLPMILGVLLTGIAAFSYNYGISKELNAIVAPIAGSYPILFVLLAFIFFKDPIRKQQVFGIITVLLGIVLLSVSAI